MSLPSSNWVFAIKATSVTVGQLHQVLVTNLIELHDRYRVYVTECFSDHFLFQKALDDAFRMFLDWGVFTISTGEYLINFCDNIFRRGRPGKLSDEAMDETLGKLSGDIHEEVESHNHMLDRMNDMDSSRAILSGTMDRFKAVFETKSSRRMFTLVASFVVLFLVIYYLTK